MLLVKGVGQSQTEDVGRHESASKWNNYNNIEITIDYI